MKHREKYAQYVNEMVKELVVKRIGLDCILASKDEHFNDIKWLKWDALEHSWLKEHITKKNKELRGESSWSLCEIVGVAKEAARQIKERKENARD